MFPYRLQGKFHKAAFGCSIHIMTKSIRLSIATIERLLFIDPNGSGILFSIIFRMLASFLLPQVHILMEDE